MYAHAEAPIEIFLDGIEIAKIVTGAHHTLILGRDGKLYGFGARKNGQLDGVNDGPIKEQCAIREIELPNGVGGEGQRIVDIKASNVRSQLTTEDGQVWFWGGFFYDCRDYFALKQRIEGYNLLNEEEGLPDRPIV